MKMHAVWMASLATLVAAAACGETVASSELDANTTAIRPVREAIAGKVTLRILAQGEGSRRYLLGDGVDTLRYPELVSRLEALPRGGPHDTTVYIYTYPDARGFDVIRAMQAAEAVGFRKVVGVADYSDSQSLRSRMNWKEWEQELGMRSGDRRHGIDSVAK